MSYSYENLAIDKTKVNFLQKCFYLINLIKTKNFSKWEELMPLFEALRPEDSWDFYQHLVEVYKSFQEEEKPKAAKKAPVKKSAASKKKAPAKKPVKKKVSKKPTKKK